MRRRDFTIGLLLAAGIGRVRAQQPANQHRIAIVIPAGAIADISESSDDPLYRRLYQPFFEELRRLGDVEGTNLVVERYSGEGRPDGFPELARDVVGRNPDVIVVISNPVALAARAATGAIPIVWIGVGPIEAGLVTSLAHPGGNITGVSLFDAETYAKRLQILRDAVPSASRVAYLSPRKAWENAGGKALQRRLQEVGRRLQLSVLPMLVQESTPAEYQRAFAGIAPERPDALIVNDIADHFPYRQLLIELAEKSRLPAIYGYREYVEAGGLMAYGADFGELMRRMADDVHEILSGTEAGDIPIYQATKFEFVINLKAAKALGLTLPPALLAGADEVIE
jgi:putative tryptophan/tyrosine transport system substrate-binding protein